MVCCMRIWVLWLSHILSANCVRLGLLMRKDDVGAADDACCIEIST